jgi:hypothetical protein
MSVGTPDILGGPLLESSAAGSEKTSSPLSVIIGPFHHELVQTPCLASFRVERR